ncbi:MAG TPA: TlpA disulfide reductase family protein [Terriglobales bacterium]
MEALKPGTRAPDIALTSTNGKPFILSNVLERGPAVMAFFKVSCPTCQYAFPYLERMFQAHKTEAMTIVGISQDNLESTRQFMKQYGVTFPVLLDDPGQYRASKDYGLTNVPTVFLISDKGKIELTSVGWARGEMEELNSQLAMMSPEQNVVPIFRAGEQVVEYKAA